MQMRNKILVCACGVVLASAAVLADTRVEFKVTEGTGSATSMVIAQGKIRSDADKNTTVILDPTAGVMTIIDHSRKTFTKMTKADVDALVKQLEEMMAGIPPEMRQMMAGRMGGAGGAVTFAPTGKTETIAGKSCQVYSTTVAGRVIAESCMADISAIEVPAADRATMVAAAAWAKDLMESFTKIPMLGNMAKSVPFRGGVPLRTTTIESNGTRNTSEFAGVSNAAVSADTFTVPAGYKEQKMDMGRGRGGRP